jgi:hypothetical protein
MDKPWKLYDLQAARRANGQSMSGHRKVIERANGSWSQSTWPRLSVCRHSKLGAMEMRGAQDPLRLAFQADENANP